MNKAKKDFNAILKEQVKQYLNEQDIKLEPKLAFAIYNILKKDFPDISKKHATESAFFYYLNSKL